ncbi:MAG: Glycosyl transferase group 1 [Microgenomates group bacterium GW2011_GWC1_43_11]|uniref:Glycosyl transferase group 1 n=1 Tax=Candidatus Gottesmanbacteria bacterium GW2011_GWA1_44_24b TaxID=1618437 RepID=A0A0G1LMC8_9BACT|nr:MAG: Glycosyl transferase group 1 [Microgenomates group bacterium GW2011_GWC1_43_11]KKT61014.1 MAG: Glycosyl transferase group 1 [Candidatus Gottesmanbacteria bacterium GW2011_GWA1_44_24b]
MLSNNLIIVACNLPFDWSTDYPYQTSKELSKNNLVICWMLQGIPLKEYLLQRKVPKLFTKQAKNLYFYQPIDILPFRRFPIIYAINMQMSTITLMFIVRFIQRFRHFKRTILWVFDPRYTHLYRQLEKRIFFMYDCIDYFRGDPLLSNKQQKKLIDHENELIRTADVVTVNSSILFKIHSPIRTDIHIVPQGFRLDVFVKNFKSHVGFPTDKPIIGYVGALNYRLDYHLLVKLAKRLPQYLFVFVGPLQKDNTLFGVRWLSYARKCLFSLSNVTVIYGVEKKEIKNVIAQFDIGMIPYDVSQDFNRYCFPMKLFEYFYVGKPVIATPIKELKRFPKFVKIGKTVKDWENIIIKLLSVQWPLDFQKEQKKLAFENRWKNKINQILQFIY